MCMRSTMLLFFVFCVFKNSCVRYSVHAVTSHEIMVFHLKEKPYILQDLTNANVANGNRL